MARIRTIKPEFFTSETIAALPLSARLTFIGLWTHVDDYGVCLGNERLIHAAVWPLEEDPRESLARTREDIASLSELGLVTLYHHSDKRYLHVTGWAEHQKVDRPGRRRLPLPTDPGSTTLSCLNAEFEGSSREIRESIEDSSRLDLGPRNREQGPRNREQGPGSARDEASGSPTTASKKLRVVSDEDPDFAAFWDAYPRKTAKGAARSVWTKVVLGGKGRPPVSSEALIEGAKRYAAYCGQECTAPQYIAHPSTWLNGERWKDELRASEIRSANGHRPYKNPDQREYDKGWPA